MNDSKGYVQHRECATKIGVVMNELADVGLVGLAVMGQNLGNIGELLGMTDGPWIQRGHHARL